MEGKKENNITIIKILYVWQEKNDTFQSRYKIMRSSESNISIPILNTYYNNNEILLRPRHISINPFIDDNSLLVICDIFNIEGENLNYDKRYNLIKILEKYKDNIDKNNPKFT